MTAPVPTLRRMAGYAYPEGGHWCRYRREALDFPRGECPWCLLGEVTATFSPGASPEEFREMARKMGNNGRVAPPLRGRK